MRSRITKINTKSSFIGIEICDVVRPFSKVTEPFSKAKSKLPLTSLHVTCTVPRWPAVLTMLRVALEADDSATVELIDVFAKLKMPYASSLGRIVMLM